MSAAEKALAALEAAGKAATERPWTVHGRYIGTRFHKSYVGECRDENGNWSDTAKSRGDSALIAFAVNLSAPLAAVARAAMNYVKNRTNYDALESALDALEAAAEGVL